MRHLTIQVRGQSHQNDTISTYKLFHFTQSYYQDNVINYVPYYFAESNIYSSHTIISLTTITLIIYCCFVFSFTFYFLFLLKLLVMHIHLNRLVQVSYQRYAFPVKYKIIIFLWAHSLKVEVYPFLRKVMDVTPLAESCQDRRDGARAPPQEGYPHFN